jgi:hypothetical protein
MLTKHDLQGRIRRFEQLLAGLNAELVRMAMEHEPWTREEKNGYLEATAGMATKAQHAIAALRPAVGRLVSQEQLARGILL